MVNRFIYHRDKTVRWPSIQLKLHILGEPEYLIILSSECSLGSIQPGPTLPGPFDRVDF